MLKQTSYSLQLLWGVIVVAIVVVSLFPRSGIQASFLGANLNRHWVEFLAYVAVSILPLLAWRRRAGLTISIGMAVLAAGLEIIRALLEGRSPGIQYIAVSSFGIAAGILLGLNILTLRSRVRHVDT